MAMDFASIRQIGSSSYGVCNAVAVGSEEELVDGPSARTRDILTVKNFPQVVVREGGRATVYCCLFCVPFGSLLSADCISYLLSVTSFCVVFGADCTYHLRFWLN